MYMMGLINIGSIYSLRYNTIIFICIINIISIIKAQTVSVISADSFVESICVNTHWAGGTIYLRNYTALRAKLGESGIRYIRDETYPNTYAPIMDLYRSFGIKINMLFGRGPSGPHPPLNLSNIGEELNQMKTQALPAVVSLENPNEYDYEHGPDTDWVERLRNYSRILYTLAKADEELKNLPVIGPSMTAKEGYQAVGNLDPYIDHPNIHIYQKYWPGYTNVTDLSQGGITWYFNFDARRQSPSRKPVIATEMGYTNYIPDQGISEEAAGKYMARTFAEFFRRGIVRTCPYEFADELKDGREGNFGLIRLNMTEKPAFRGVKNIIAILSDKGPDFKLDSFNYVFDGNVSNLRHILFQKRNGDFYLMVWLEVSSWDTQNNIDLYPPPQEVILTILTDYNVSNATIYTLDNNANLNTYVLPIDNYQMAMNVTDKISIIKLTNTTQI